MEEKSKLCGSCVAVCLTFSWWWEEEEEEEKGLGQVVKEGRFEQGCQPLLR